MIVEFRVLGPLEVLIDGEPVALGGMRPRAVLAALLRERNRVVDVSRLIRAVWGDDTPSTAVAQIRIEISFLRQKLADADHTRIRTYPHGYLIRVDEGELDLEEFDDDAEAGLRALRSRDPRTAVDLLRAAEGRWRGDVLDDLGAFPVHNFALAIAGRRAAAREARIAGELMLELHLDLVPELRAMDTGSEQLAGFLMIALYRSGRRKEALQVFHDARREAEEVGLDPPRELATLYGAIAGQHDGEVGAWLLRRYPPTDAGRTRPQDDVTRRPSSTLSAVGDAPDTAEEPAVVLHVVTGAAAGRSYRCTGPRTWRVGRGAECDVRLDRDPLVSRRHCVLDIDPPAVRIRDEGSRNGTTVDGRRIGPEWCDLANGAGIELGGVLIRVEVAPAVPAEPPPREPHVDELPSRVVGYRFLGELARGDASVVHLVEHEDTGEQAVLKMLRLDDGPDDRARAEFLREVELSAVLRHPHIVRLRDSGTVGSVPFVVHDHCDGGSVEDLLAGPLPVEESVALAVQVLDGLAYAHDVPLPAVRRGDGTTAAARGLVHRDVKPSNILLCGSGPDRVAKLADFGLAKAYDQAGLSGHSDDQQLGGTVEYLCRRQLLDYRFAGPEVDVWATAATLYRMLTGATPRDFSPYAEPILVVLQTSAVPVRERAPHLPARLAAVLDAALVDDPEPVVTSAAELRDALVDAL